MLNLLKPFIETNLEFSISVALLAFLVLIFFGKLTSKDSRESFSVIMMGEFKGWAVGFIELFDRIFGKKHLSWRCFFRSSIASILTVLLLYHLFGTILELVGEEQRTRETIDFIGVLGLGIILNIIPDYISLFQTRWILKQYSKRNSLWMQILILLIDLVLSALIIFLAINIYVLVTGGEWVSIAKLVGAYNNYTIFFYSTFLTSLLAWIYLLSFWVIRIVDKMARVLPALDLEHQGVTIFSLIFSLMIFSAVYFAKPLVEKLSESGAVGSFFCSISVDTCKDVYQLTDDDVQKLYALSRHCSGTGETNLCLSEGLSSLKLKPENAIKLFRVACDGGNMLGCNNLGTMYQKGQGVPQEYSKAVDLYQQACDAGVMIGCYNLGTMYQLGRSIPRDQNKAVKQYQQACDGGYIDGCYRLGFMYQEGKGIPQNQNKAVELFQRVCDEGEMRGCNNLGTMYQKGQGVPRDLSKALGLYQQACDGGDMLGCTDLGTMYQYTLGFPRDPSKAIELFQQACDGGEMRGCNRLGFIYDNGQGVPQDQSRAMELYQKTCDGGYSQACSEIAPPLNPPILNLETNEDISASKYKSEFHSMPFAPRNIA